MLEYLEYLNVPAKIILLFVILFLIMQIIGEFLEFKGKVVPEIFKVRKYMKRKKIERETLRELPETIKEVHSFLKEYNKLHSPESLEKRKEWKENVDSKFNERDKLIVELNKKLDRNNKDTISLLIDSKRNTIINFASRVADENSLVTREQFKRIFKIHKEYEDIIEKNGLTNGEVNIAIRIINESYEKHLKNKTFIEDVRGYEINEKL